jgi:hypothetical protein
VTQKQDGNSAAAAATAYEDDGVSEQGGTCKEYKWLPLLLLLLQAHTT